MREFDLAQQGFRRQAELERKNSIRRPFSSARRAEAGIDLMQLRIVESRQLRITEEGNGATEDDIGLFWFVPGYSAVGGPDIVPEE